MNTVRVTVITVLAFLTLGMGSAPAGPPEGFQYISEWGVHARGDDLFWHAGVQWKLKDGTWVKLEAGNWIPDPYPPAVIVAIPKDKAHCPPGLAKKGCVPPGQQKNGPPGQRKKGY
ncbi:MAG: hypothetical protein ACREJ1_03890 [Candidatus Methylomirabilales bacterium]